MEIGSNSTENCFEHVDKDAECTVVNIDDDVLGAGMRRLVAFTIGTIITVLNGHCAQENDLAEDAPKYLDEKNYIKKRFIKINKNLSIIVVVSGNFIV